MRGSGSLLVYAHASEGRRVVATCGERVHQLGVGKVAAAVTLSRALDELTPTWVLAFGVCGAFPAGGLAVGELCLITEEVLGDEGVATPGGFQSLGELSLGDDTIWLADSDWTGRVREAVGAIPEVRGATVSTCSGTDELSAQRAARTGAAVETMEGAAIAAVCAAWGVPWVQLRAVGNHTGDRKRAQFGLAGACGRVQDAVLQLVHAGVV